jgi:hypothetical protein
VVRYADGHCTGRVEDADALWAEWDGAKETWFADASVRPRLVITEAMLRSLPEVLQGDQLPTDIIFPGGSVDQVRAVYQGNPLADFFDTRTNRRRRRLRPGAAGGRSRGTPAPVGGRRGHRLHQRRGLPQAEASLTASGKLERTALPWPAA